MVNNSVIRCPYCLCKQKADKSKIVCRRCRKSFSLQRAIKSSSSGAANLPINEVENKKMGLAFLFMIIIILLCNLYVYKNSSSIDGPDFIAKYIVFFFFTLLLRHTIAKNQRLLIIILFTTVAVNRAIISYQDGLRSFELLAMITFIGCWLLSPATLSQVFSENNNNSSGCGGGCGGGCSGGCGGCG